MKFDDFFELFASFFLSSSHVGMMAVEKNLVFSGKPRVLRERRGTLGGNSARWRADGSRPRACARVRVLVCVLVCETVGGALSQPRR